jgi:CBS domain-containing protein
VINAVPIIDNDGTISGIVSSSDSFTCQDDTKLVQDVISTFIHVVAPNNRVKDAAKTMGKHRVHHPVVMEDDKVIGMLSAIDSIKLFAALD